MPGTVVRDALAPNLFTGSTLNAAGTTNGTAHEIGWPGQVQFALNTGTVTGTSPTLNVEIQGADDSGFTTNVVSLGRFAQVTASNSARQFTVHVDKRYVRAVVVVGGTSPVFTGSTLVPVPRHDRRVRKTTTA